ncbi:MAG TPA: S8 family serine peptidase [Anaerolineae bacterium]|nr:S8 family serine peptidase [Anaerolineae bacterium]
MDNKVETVAPNPEFDLLGFFFAFFSFVWLLAMMLVPNNITWFIQQMLIVGGVDWFWGIWPLVHLGQLVAILIPTILLTAFWQQKRYQTIFKTWLAAATYFTFLWPVRLAPFTAARTAVSLQIACSAVFLICLYLYLRRTPPPPTHNQPSPPLMTLFAPLIFLIWLTIGALGSPLDTLLNFTAALLFAAIMTLIICRILWPGLAQTSEGFGWDITTAGYVGGLTLLIGATGFGTNGSQILLMYTLPTLAWLIATLLPRTITANRPSSQTETRSLFYLLTAATAGPLLFFDPDEILLVLFGRDAFFWVVISIALIVIIGWSVGIVLPFTHQFLRTMPPQLASSITIISLLALLPIYFFIGQPGFHGEKLFVIFADQADLSSATIITDYDQRRQFVYDTLVNQADNSQTNIRQSLDRLGIDYTSYYLVNALAVDANPFLRRWLEAQPGVERVIDNPMLRPMPLQPAISNLGMSEPATEPQWNLTMINAPQVWSQFAVRGQGIIIGQSDSGVDGQHPELSQQYRGYNGDDDYNWYDPWYDTTEPQDWSGHGTHTLGTILGQTVGVAPDAQWFGCSNLARNLANPTYYLDCMQFMLAPFPQGGDPFRDGDPTRSAHVLNNSWGCPPIEGCDPKSLQPAVAALRAAGIFVVASAGNDGDYGCETVQNPIAIYDESFTVGAVDASNELATFSSVGPVAVDDSYRLKPDIVAPGVDVYSAMPNNKYLNNDGTSMAGPHVVGVVALIWSANPDLIGDIDTTEQIIIDTAIPYTNARPICGDSTNNSYGYGLINAYGAVEAALQRR